MLRMQEQVLGFGGMKHMLWRERDVLNLYYRFTPSVWGQGYASELARTALDLAQAHLPPWPIVAITRASNIASQRTAAHIGLRRRPDLDTELVVFALGWPASDDTEGDEGS